MCVPNRWLRAVVFFLEGGGAVGRGVGALVGGLLAGGGAAAVREGHGVRAEGPLCGGGEEGDAGCGGEEGGKWGGTSTSPLLPPSLGKFRS